MTDYKKSTGSSGVMMIRDTGSYVEFWLNSYNSTTYNYNLPWGGTVNGSTFTRTSSYSKGAGWVKLGSWYVSSSQTVTFRLFDTGTSGFGGPTTFSVSISRSKIPDPPPKPTLTKTGFNRVLVTFKDGDNNGSAIDARQIAYGTSSAAPNVGPFASDGSTEFTNLVPGVRIYFFARTHNAYGWSKWSDPENTIPGKDVYVKYLGVWRPAVPYVRMGGVWREAWPYVRKLGTWQRV